MQQRPRRIFHLFSLLVLAMMVGPAEGQQTLPGAESDFHLTLESKWMYGPVSGHLQTPSGGRPGTTSGDRPSLGEIGINTASILDAEVRPGLGEHEIYVGGQWVRLSGERELEEDLVSRDNFFAAGSGVESDVKLDWYRLGYRYQIQRGDERDVDLPVEIHSRFGVAMLDFRYQLDGAGGAEVDRAYIKPAAQMGVEMEWQATRRLSIAGELTWTLPFSSHPFIVTANVTGRYGITARSGAGVSGFVGAGYEKISFRDGQETANDINADFGPMLTAGVELRF